MNKAMRAQCDAEAEAERLSAMLRAQQKEAASAQREAQAARDRAAATSDESSLLRCKLACMHGDPEALSSQSAGQLADLLQVRNGTTEFASVFSCWYNPWYARPC